MFSSFISKLLLLSSFLFAASSANNITACGCTCECSGFLCAEAGKAKSLCGEATSHGITNGEACSVAQGTLNKLANGLATLSGCTGTFDSGTKNNFFIALKQHNSDVLLDAFYNVSNPESSQYGKYWTQEQINDLVAPPAHEAQSIIDFFNLYNFDCSVRGGDALECQRRENLCENQKDTSHIDLSGIFSPKIDFIEVNKFAYDAPKTHSVGNGDGYVAREVLIKLYNITHNTVTYPSTSVCAVEYQGAGGISNTDLEMQQTLNDQPKKPINNIVGINQSPMMEAQLDVQMMSEVAQNSDVWMWGATQWLYSFAVDFLNKSSVPEVLSMSWGWSARQQCSAGLGQCPGNMTSAQYLHRVNMEYVKMGLRGITVTVSSGDAGAAGRTNEGCSMQQGVNPVNPGFPGSSPYITSVSATYIVPQQPLADNTWGSSMCKQYGCVNGTYELPCNYAKTGWTTGGGFAIYNETRPKWQNAAVEQYLKSHAKRPSRFQKTGRGYPDVAAVGHNCPTVMNGQLMGVDGTSCSSPIFAALVALLNDHQKTMGKPNLGFMNPVLYKMWTDNKEIFHDITEGNNWCTEMQCCNSSFGYESSVGWDPVTGLGTPNFGLMMDWLDQNT